MSRKDYQIKHMGHRIELGEIEANVLLVDGIQTAFEPQRQLPSSKPPSPLVFFLISTHFTATLGIPLTSPAL